MKPIKSPSHQCETHNKRKTNIHKTHHTLEGFYNTYFNFIVKLLTVRSLNDALHNIYFTSLIFCAYESVPGISSKHPPH